MGDDDVKHKYFSLEYISPAEFEAQHAPPPENKRLCAQAHPVSGSDADHPRGWHRSWIAFSRLCSTCV